MASGRSIAISCCFVRTGRVGGAEYMLKNLVAGLSAARDRDDEIIAYGPSEFVLGLESVTPVVLESGNRFIGDWKAARAGAGCDGFLFPNYFTPPGSYSGRVVTVIHDLNYRHFPGQFSRAKRLWLRAVHHYSLYRSDRVIVISDFVARDISAQYGRGFRATVEVIPNPVSWDRFVSRGDPEEDYDSRRYILTVGAAYPHKNLETLIRAFSKLAARVDDVDLAIVGATGSMLVGVTRTSDANALVAELGISERVDILGHVGDEHLGRLYRHATVFAFPSLFEGFGMPPVEALGLNLPALTTSRAAIPESTLGQANYVQDPCDPDEWAARLEEILEDPDSYRPRDPAAIRRHYSVERVGAMYYRALTS